MTIGPNLGPSHPSNPLNTLNMFASAESLLQRSLLMMIMMMIDDYDDDKLKIKVDDADDDDDERWWWWWKMMMMKDEYDDDSFTSGSLTTSALLFLSSQGLDFNILLFHNRQFMQFVPDQPRFGFQSISNPSFSCLHRCRMTMREARQKILLTIT